jgi:phage terminase small subunit
METLRKATYFSPKRNKVAEIIKNKPEISMTQAMLQAGYSHHTATTGKEMKKVRNSPQVQQALKQHQQQIDKLIQNSYKYALKKQKEATFRDNIDAITKLHKTSIELKQSNIDIDDFFKEEERTDVILERIQRITLKKG